MKMPIGGSPTMVITPGDEAPSENRMRNGQAANLGHHLRALHLRDVPDGKEDRRLGETVIGHVQQPGEIRERPAHPERERDDAHVLDGGIGEHALDVVPPVQHERREQDGDQPERDHQRTGRQRAGVGRHHHLEAQHREQRDVQQQSRQHGGNRGRALGMRVGEPRVQRREADLGAVTQQQEHEGEIEQRRIEGRAHWRPGRSRPSRRGPRRPPSAPRDRRGSFRRARARSRRCPAGNTSRPPRALPACGRCRPSGPSSASPIRRRPTSARRCSRAAPGSSRTSASGTWRGRSEDRPASDARSRARARCSSR